MSSYGCSPLPPPPCPRPPPLPKRHEAEEVDFHNGFVEESLYHTSWAFVSWKQEFVNSKTATEEGELNPSALWTWSGLGPLSVAVNNNALGF